MLNLLNTRELSILIWITVVIAVQLFNPEKRDNLKDIFKLLIGKNLIIGNFIFMGYIIGFVFLLRKFGIWDMYLLKDTVYWFLTAAYVLFLNMTKAKSFNYFKEIFIEVFKWTIIIEFIINLYTFNLITELVLVPVVCCLTLMLGMAKKDVQFNKVVKLINGVLALLSFFALYYVLKHVLPDFTSYLSYQNLCSFILVPILTISLIPVLYSFSMFVHYQELFTDVGFMTKDKYKLYQIKKQIIIIANVNINRISAMREKINKQDLFTAADLKFYLKQVATIN